MDWVNLIGGGFAYMSAPFGVHPRDNERAREYRAQAEAARLGWGTIEEHLNAYAATQGWNSDKRAQARQEVRTYMNKHLPSCFRNE